MYNFYFFKFLLHHHLLSPPDHGVIRSDRVFSAMLATDRGIYCRDYPYADSPQNIGTQSSHIYTDNDETMDHGRIIFGGVLVGLVMGCCKEESWILWVAGWTFIAM